MFRLFTNNHSLVFSTDAHKLLLFMLAISAVINNANAESNPTYYNETQGISVEDQLLLVEIFGSTVLGICCLVIATTCYCSRHTLHQFCEERGVALLESDSEEPATEWENLYDQLVDIAEAHPNNAEAQSLLDTVTQFKEHKSCQINVSMSNNPVTLPCQHIYDFNSLVEWRDREINQNTQVKCPCCKEPYKRRDIKIDDALKDVIANHLTSFKDQLAKLISNLENLNEDDASVRASLRSNSASFYSIPSTDSIDELQPANFRHI